MLQKIGIDRYNEIGSNSSRFRDRPKIASGSPPDDPALARPGMR
jgi:hypothetical protein